jgi:cytochrome c553
MNARALALALALLPAAVSAQVTERPLPLTGAPPAAAVCTACHSSEMIDYQPRLTLAQWRATVLKMKTAYGAPVPDESIDDIARWLVARQAGSGQAAAAGPRRLP